MRNNVGRSINTLTLTALALLCHVPALQAQGTGAEFPESDISRFIYVSPSGSDDNPGTSDAPLGTISKAVSLAKSLNRQNLGVKILLADGTYREYVGVYSFTDRFGATVGTSKPLAIEAINKGQAIINGADVWNSGWIEQGTSNIYAHVWTDNWGLIYSSLSTAPELSQRQEMIFINEQLLRQVLSYAELTPGTFFVDAFNFAIFISPPSGVDLSTATVEVARRGGLFLQNNDNVAVRGLVVKYTSGGSGQRAGLTVDNQTESALIEDCHLIWNNTGGLTLSYNHNFILRRNTLNNNGSSGISGYKNANVLFEDNETSYNNWRGDWANYYGWDRGGIKMMFTHGASYVRHKTVGNMAKGLWLDTDNSNIVIDGLFSHGNRQEGLYLEASEGPFLIQNSIICHAGSARGFTSTNTSDVTLESNIFYGNAKAQIWLPWLVDWHDTRSVARWDEGTNQTIADAQQLRTERWTIRNNTFVGTSSTQMVMNVGGWDHFLSSLIADNNLYWNGQIANAIEVGTRSDGVNTFAYYTLSGWQFLTDQDLNSTFTDPNFIDPENHIFTSNIGNTKTTTTLLPFADTYVQDGPGADSNYGLYYGLVTKTISSTSGYNRESYLMFDLDTPGSITSAKLRLYGSISGTYYTNSLFAVYAVTDTTWTETGLTWNTKPVYGSTPLATETVSGDVDQWYELDITPFIQAEKNAGHNLASLVLKNITYGPYVIFNSRQASDNQPQLVVEGVKQQ